MKAEEVWNGKAHVLWWVSISLVVPEPFKAQKLFLDLKGPVDGSDESGGRWVEKPRYGRIIPMLVLHAEGTARNEFALWKRRHLLKINNNCLLVNLKKEKPLKQRCGKLASRVMWLRPSCWQWGITLPAVLPAGTLVIIATSVISGLGPEFIFRRPERRSLHKTVRAIFMYKVLRPLAFPSTDVQVDQPHSHQNCAAQPSIFSLW